MIDRSVPLDGSADSALWTSQRTRQPPPAVLTHVVLYRHVGFRAMVVSRISLRLTIDESMTFNSNSPGAVKRRLRSVSLCTKNDLTVFQTPRCGDRFRSPRRVRGVFKRRPEAEEHSKPQRCSFLLVSQPSSLSVYSLNLLSLRPHPHLGVVNQWVPYLYRRYFSPPECFEDLLGRV